MRKQHGKDTWALFIDPVKALDTGNHELFLILKKIWSSRDITNLSDCENVQGCSGHSQSWRRNKRCPIQCGSEARRQYGTSAIYILDEPCKENIKKVKF